MDNKVVDVLKKISEREEILLSENFPSGLIIIFDDFAPTKILKSIGFIGK
jgi:hypothetical protein